MTKQEQIQQVLADLNQELDKQRGMLSWYLREQDRTAMNRAFEAVVGTLLDQLEEEKMKNAARVEPSVPCVEPTGSTAEMSPGAVTAAERTEKKRRYCPMCDEWMYATVCRACGMATEVGRKP